MDTKARLKHFRMSARKVRLVTDVVKGMQVDKALNQLNFLNKKASKPLAKLVNSAISNAEHNFELSRDNLYIKEIKVDEGLTLKRWQPRAFGRATPLRKRASHISLILGEIKDSGEKEGKKPKAGEPVKMGTASKEVKGERKKDKEEKQEEKEAPKKTSSKAAKGPKKEIFDEKREGKGKHQEIEGGAKVPSKKTYRKKSG